MKNEIDEYSSTNVNEDFEELLEFPFLYVTLVPSMKKKELTEFYTYVVRKAQLDPENESLKDTIADLEEMETIQQFLNGEFDPNTYVEPVQEEKPKKIKPFKVEPDLTKDEEIEQIMQKLHERKHPGFIKRLIKQIKG